MERSIWNEVILQKLLTKQVAFVVLKSKQKTKTIQNKLSTYKACIRCFSSDISPRDCGLDMFFPWFLTWIFISWATLWISSITSPVVVVTIIVGGGGGNGGALRLPLPWHDRLLLLLPRRRIFAHVIHQLGSQNSVVLTQNSQHFCQLLVFCFHSAQFLY